MIGRDRRMPDVRLGLASGPVVQRLGDVFGPPVNMAARLTAVARRNRLIIDQKTADLLPDEEWETAGSRPARCAASGSSSRSPYAAADAACGRGARSAGLDQLCHNFA